MTARVRPRIRTCACPSAVGPHMHACPRSRKRRKVSPAWNGTNAGYQANKAAGLCDDCGRRSKRIRCARCRARRSAQPSRQAAYRRKHEKARKSKLVSS